jgi:hypothetical protein
MCTVTIGYVFGISIPLFFQNTGKKQAREVIMFSVPTSAFVESSWIVMAHGDARKGKWRGNWQMEWVVSTLYTTSERGVSSITTADAHTSAASSRLNWGPCRFKWTRPFRRSTKSVFCACAITFQTQSTSWSVFTKLWTFRRRRTRISTWRTCELVRRGLQERSV